MRVACCVKYFIKPPQLLDATRNTELKTQNSKPSSPHTWHCASDPPYCTDVIDTEQLLAEYLPVIRAAEWIAVDTEADSLHAYPEKVCLIQISTAQGDRLVDPLAGFSIDPLLDALNAHQLIMHGADYDLRLLRKHHEFVPGAIFDTMLAARLLGHRQFGLQSLVETLLSVKLDKGPQKADWARRPLTERMEVYARNDTHFLKPIADKLRAELQEKGRLAWQEESCARLIQDCTQGAPPDPDSLWRVKGSHALSRAAMAVLRELWLWREAEATHSNRPPFFILNHETMVGIADAAGARQPFDELIPKHLTPRRRQGLQTAVHDGLSIPVDQQPKHLKRLHHWPTEAEKRRFVELAKHRDAQAEKLGIDPTLIASRATLGELARDWDKHAAELMNWQRELMK
ncbi:MAG: ribonuclease D [Verrucomicrobia bacterium]|nr:MAG: ribonuclease D [Verrucomicrobiota bacterium]